MFVVKTGRGRGKQGFNFCYLKFDMPGDHANGDVKQREYTELRGYTWAVNINVGVTKL